MRVDQLVVQNFAQYGDVRLPHRLVPAPLHLCDRVFHGAFQASQPAWTTCIKAAQIDDCS
jgi:hypothetical protein